MSMLENLAAAVLLLGLVMYALFGGADFGGGIWSALASGPRADEQREKLSLAMGPVWETNHVWLIFVIVTLLTAFPKGFAALFIALLAPLVLVLVGINFRGAAFAFSHFGRRDSRAVRFIIGSFGVSSAISPLALGMAMTATATQRLIVDTERGGVPWGWISPFTVTGGLIGIGVCAYLAPIYMTLRTTAELRNDFRNRGIAAGIALGILTAVEIPVALNDAPLFAWRLLHSWGALFVGLAVICGIVTQLLLWRGRYLWAQLLAAITVASTMTGFCAALYPDLLIGRLSLAAAAAPRATLIAFFAVLPCGMVVLVPSLLYLYWTFRGEPGRDLLP